jgi:hypothetical protein
LRRHDDIAQAILRRDELADQNADQRQADCNFHTGGWIGMIAARGFSGRPIPDQPSRTATSISIVHRFGVGTAVYGEVIPDQPSRIPRAVLRLAARSTPRRKRRRWSSMPRPIPDPTIVTNFLTMTTDRKATLPSESGSEAFARLNFARAPRDGMSNPYPSGRPENPRAAIIPFVNRSLTNGPPIGSGPEWLMNSAHWFSDYSVPVGWPERTRWL